MPIIRFVAHYKGRFPLLNNSAEVIQINIINTFKNEPTACFVGLAMRKPVFRVSHEVRFKPAYSAKETS